MRWTEAQLSEFMGRRTRSDAQPKQRGASLVTGETKARALGPKEAEIQTALIEHLRHLAAPNVVYWHTPNGELRDVRIARKLKAMGATPGIPDLAVLAGGRLHFLELKRDRGGSPSGAQKLMHQALIAAGAEVATARGLDEALGVLRRWGVMRCPHTDKTPKAPESAQRGQGP